jgi:hypothetical protein
MKTLIYHTQPTFASGFIYEAEQMMNKLSFITKDEYLDWVKKWKEDYKIVERQHKIEKYWLMRDYCATEAKKERYQKKLDKVQELTSDETARVATLMLELQKYADTGPWFKSSYWLTVYFLVQRKASKLRANSQWHIEQGEKLLRQQSKQT